MHQVVHKATKKEENSSTNKSTLFKNYYDKTFFKVKTETVIADKKYADLTVKEKKLVPPFIYNKTNL
jgi:hypothetical protein